MRHAKSRLVEDADESAPVRLQTAPTGPDNKFTPIYRGDRNRGAKVSIYLWNSL